MQQQWEHDVLRYAVCAVLDGLSFDLVVSQCVACIYGRCGCGHVATAVSALWHLRLASQTPALRFLFFAWLNTLFSPFHSAGHALE
jgi:hypothetical protein